MNPELPRVNVGGETAPQAPNNVEYRAYSQENSPEFVRDIEPSREAVSRAEQGNNTSATAALPSVMPNVAQNSQVSIQTTVPQNPPTAADDDVIEKEWVDKLKRVISLTREDPYERAKVIAQLQADYLKKRYNRDLGQADEAGK